MTDHSSAAGRTGSAGGPQRIPLASLPTPLVPLDRLGRHLGLEPGALWVKHDDLTGLAGGGNKVRKLEYLCADALARDCDRLVTGGGRQSNHARLTAAAANRLGLGCTVVLGGRRPDRATGNVLLDELLGADIRWVGDLDYESLERAIVGVSEALADAGGHPYSVPIGGATPLGALGYLDAAAEIANALPGVASVVVACGSGGTLAGLAAGFGSFERVLGVDVGTRPDLDEQVPAMAAATAGLAGIRPPTGMATMDHDHVGAGYGAPSPEARAALRLAARLEGIVVDPVYTAKALAALIARVGAGALPASAERPVVFLHTGGVPALFSPRYADWLAADDG